MNHGQSCLLLPNAILVDFAIEWELISLKWKDYSGYCLLANLLDHIQVYSCMLVRFQMLYVYFLFIFITVLRTASYGAWRVACCRHCMRHTLTADLHTHTQCHDLRGEWLVCWPIDTKLGWFVAVRIAPFVTILNENLFMIIWERLFVFCLLMSFSDVAIYRLLFCVWYR